VRRLCVSFVEALTGIVLTHAPQLSSAQLQPESATLCALCQVCLYIHDVHSCMLSVLSGWKAQDEEFFFFCLVVCECDSQR
jgi:hypothetical protein